MVGAHPRTVHDLVPAAPRAVASGDDRGATPVGRLEDFGGWSTPTVPDRIATRNGWGVSRSLLLLSLVPLSLMLVARIHGPGGPQWQVLTGEIARPVIFVSFLVAAWRVHRRCTLRIAVDRLTIHTFLRSRRIPWDAVDAIGLECEPIQIGVTDFTPTVRVLGDTGARTYRLEGFAERSARGSIPRMTVATLNAALVRHQIRTAGRRLDSPAARHAPSGGRGQRPTAAVRTEADASRTRTGTAALGAMHP